MGFIQLRVMAETQPKPGNLYTPGTSGEKRVHERDKMKKAKIRIIIILKTGRPGQCSVTGSPRSRGPRTWGGGPTRRRFS